MSDVLVSVDSVRKKFCRTLRRSLWYGAQDMLTEMFGCRSDGELRQDEFWAIKDVSFELRRGECLGLIGRNGAGKTTLLKMLTGLIKPDQGRIEMHGRVSGLIALGAGFNPILTGRENIYVNGTVLGLSTSEIDGKIDEIIDFAELVEFIDSPVQNYSSGMHVRLGFAIASAMKPDILVLDEVLAVGDAHFRSKCWRRLGELLENSAVIIVSHEAYAISRLCDRAILLDNGHVTCDSTAFETLELYVSSQPVDLKSLRAVHSSVNSFVLRPVHTCLNPGDLFTFELIIDMKKSLPVDHAFINICDTGDTIHAQCLLEFPESGLSEGINAFHIALGPLFLSKGTFALVIFMSTFGGKVPLIHSRFELSFDFISHVNYGPTYYPPGVVTLVTTQSDSGIC